MNSNEKKLTPAQEDYLEVIYEITEEHKVARNKEIAEKLGVTRATVTGALKTLAEKKLINYEAHGYVTLTDVGTEISKLLIDKHYLFKYFFNIILGMSEKDAVEIACRIEHSITEDAFTRFKELISNIKNCKNANNCQSCVNDNKNKELI